MDVSAAQVSMVLSYSDSVISQKPTAKQLTLTIFGRFEAFPGEMPVNSIYKEKQQIRTTKITFSGIEIRTEHTT